MKRLIALLCVLALLAPSVALAAVFQTFFPPSAQFFLQIATASSVDGVNHQLLGINVANLDLFFVQMAPSGSPFASSGFPWLYGRVVAVVQVGPNTFRVFWNVSASTGGLNAVFIPVGQISVDFTV